MKFPVVIAGTNEVYFLYQIEVEMMGNTDKFEMIAHVYDTPERVHIPDVEMILSRLFEVLNEGGHLLLVDFDKNDDVVSDMVHNGFDQAELADLMTKIGYRDVQSKTFYTGSKIFMGQDASMFVLDSQKRTV